MQTKEYYDFVADGYSVHYDLTRLGDLSLPYPANYVRLQMLKVAFADRKNVIDVGCGNYEPMLVLEYESDRQTRTCGFDLSEQMIKQVAMGNNVIVADITQPKTYQPLVKYGPFDGLVCTGVMPHIVDEGRAIENMCQLLAPEGKIFIEFRNKLFALLTANRLTAELISDDLVEAPFNKKAREYLHNIVDMTLPPSRPYDAQLAHFHNPFEMADYFETHGFKDVNIFWYHQHPTLPALEKDNPALFREKALQMEGRTSWKNPYTCSAFVIEATKI